jgi:hypothetical protein
MTMTNSLTSSKTSARVAQTATQNAALPQHGLSLLGLFGAKDNLQAMVRLPNGRIKTVSAGARVSFSRVLGIDANGIVLEKSGHTQRIEMPGS